MMEQQLSSYTRIAIGFDGTLSFSNIDAIL